MARPKTKLAQSWQVAEIANIGLCPEPDCAAAYLALSGPAKAFLKQNADAVEEIKRQLGEMTALAILFSFFDIIVRPEAVLKPDRQTPKRLCAFLAAFPDFTLGYLATLRRAFVKHRRKPTAFNRAVVALKQQKPLLESYGKIIVPFQDATDLEICAALNVSPATYKEAKNYLAAMAAPSKSPVPAKK